MTLRLPLLAAWHWLMLLLLGVLALFGIELLVKHEQQLASSQQWQQELATAGRLRAMLESELNVPLYLTMGLASYIQANSGVLRDAELDILLPGLVQQARHIRNIGIAPGNRLQYVYPLQGNEQALNLYYPDIVEQWPVIADIIQQRRARLAGPIQLVQGGTAFIYRFPLFMNDNQYWGIISTVINIDPIWQQLNQEAQEQQVKLALRSKLSAQQFSDSFYGDNQLFYDGSLVLNISLRGADWQLALRSEHNLTGRSAPLRALMYSLTLLFLSLLGWLFYSNQQLKRAAQQITASEAYLRSVNDNVMDAIITTDENGIIETANLACYRLFGYPADSLPGLHWSSLLAVPEQVKQLYSATSSADKEVESQGLRHNGSSFSLLLARSTLNINQQHRQLLLLRDITERKKEERLKNEFVATVSHELRTPLTAISGALGLAVGGALGQLTPSQHKMLQLAHNNCTQLHQLINDLLDIEKLSGGHARFDLKPLNLTRLLQQCQTQMQSVAYPRQITLQHNEQDYWVLADEQRLRQVCLNLISNAIKFSPSESAIILLFQPLDRDIRICVLDQGPGVEHDFVPRLFTRFAQADSADNRSHAGTGLGLAICKEIMTKMHGSIGYQRQQQGSCFYFELPQQPAP
ncbi:ATP-binding protein [Arsukibacterium sp.]|uniref:ATP-binding protein n=1 Tax=Arsukibacterium sp. TaxID=1977258 RepID=UPI002FDB70EE